MTVAQLGIEVSSSQAAQGAVNLDALAASAKRAEQAANSLTPATEAAAGAHVKLSTQSMAASHAARGMIEQLAMGVSPVQALTAQMNHLSFAAGGEGGLLGALKGVGAAFAPMLTLPNLITIGVIGLATAIPSIYEAFTGAGAQSAEETLKRQKDLIDQITDAWPEAGKALKAYMAEAGKITPNEAIVATGAQIKAAQEQIASLTGQLDNMISNRGGGRSGPTNPLAFQPELLAKIRDLVHGFEDGSISAEKLRDDLAGLQLPPTLDAHTRQIIQSFSDVADQIGKAEGAAQAFSSVLEKLQSVDIIGMEFGALAGAQQNVIDKLKAMTPDLRSDAQKAKDLYAGNSMLDLDGSGKRQLDYTLKEIAAQKAQQDALKAEREAEAQAKQHAEAIKSVTASLNDQLAALTETDRQQFISEQLSRAKASAATDEGRKIAALAGSLYDQKQAVDAVNKSEQFLAQSAVDAFTSMANGSRSAADAAGDLVKTLAQAVIQAELLGSGPLAGVLGTAPAKSGGVGGLFGSIFSALFPVKHTGGLVGSESVYRAASPLIFAGAARYHGGGIAGLAPDEVPAILQRGERVIPKNAANQNGAQVIELRVSVDQNGNLRAFVESASGPVAVRVVQQTVPGMIQAGAPRAVASASRDKLLNRR